MDVVSAMRRNGADRLYLWLAVLSIGIVFAGFARTYYLKVWFATPELSGLFHLHGLVMSLWFLLFLLQVSLVAAGRRDLHRRVGVVGAVWAVVVVVVGVVTAITAARLGRSPGPPPLVFLAIPLGDMLIFPLLAGAGLYYRQRSDYHKRLMLLASLSLLTAAIARIPVEAIAAGGLPMFFALTDLCILGCVVADSLRNRRVHPAYAWGFALILASQLLRFLIADTPLWLAFAAWLVQ
jgi:hypothetical protein